jgi:hypothetical protein
VDNPGLVPSSAIVQLLNTSSQDHPPNMITSQFQLVFQNNPFLETEIVERRILQLVASSNRELFLHTTQYALADPWPSLGIKSRAEITSTTRFRAITNQAPEFQPPQKAKRSTRESVGRGDIEREGPAGGKKKTTTQFSTDCLRVRKKLHQGERRT